MKVPATIENINNGAVLEALNEAIARAGRRLGDGRGEQTVTLTMKFGEPEPDVGFVKTVHQVKLTESAPKPQACFTFQGNEGLEIDQTVDQQNPRQKTIPFPGGK